MGAGATVCGGPRARRTYGASPAPTSSPARGLGQEGFRGVPDDGAVHPAGVEGDHCLIEVGEVASLLGRRAEVFAVAAGPADVFRTVGVAVSLVAGDDRAGLEPLDGVQGVE